jgi:hypothetical protein
MVRVTTGANEEVRSILKESLGFEGFRIFASGGVNIYPDKINVCGREKPDLISLELNI